MDRVEPSQPETSSPGASHPPESRAGGVPPSGVEGQHDFEAQKRIHQQIRNDPDYDDWEYGTEPLPHEAWSTARAKGLAPPATGERA
jgi:hypothetical protein